MAPATPRRPKKSVIQFAVAAVIALVVGGLGILVTVMVVGGLAAQNAQVAEQKEAEKKKLEDELTRLKAEVQQKQTVVEKRLHEIRAAVTIPEGVKILPEMLTDVELEPGEKPAEDSFAKMGDLIGQYTARPIAPDEAITEESLVDTTGMLPVADGKRAISIKVDKIAGVNGAILPGSFVDVLAIFRLKSKPDDKDGEEKEWSISKTLLQDVRVISAGGSSIPSPSKSSDSAVSAPAPAAGGGVTLEVSPEQAELLAFANDQATFHLSLRSFGDKKRKVMFGADLSQAVNGKSPLDNLPPVAKTPTPKLTARRLSSPDPSNPAGLPAPGQAPPEPAPKTFSLQILKGSASETKQFEWTQ